MGSQLPEQVALVWRFGSCFPWTWLQPHTGKGEQPVIHRPCCSITCFRSESDLYAQSQGIPGPDCLHSQAADSQSPGSSSPSTWDYFL